MITIVGTFVSKLFVGKSYFNLEEYGLQLEYDGIFIFSSSTVIPEEDFLLHSLSN